jgi:hypothetical protein
MIKKYFVLIILTVVTVHLAMSQGTLVSAGGTLKDRFSKKAGNLMFSATTLKLGRIKNNSAKTDTIKVYNSGNSTITLSLEKVPAHMTVNLQSASLAPNSETLITVMFDAAKKNDYGFVLDRFDLATNDAEQPKKPLSVTATIEESFLLATADDSLQAPKARWSESNYDYGRVKQGDKISHEFVVRNDGKKDLLIHKAKTSCSCLKTNISKTTVAAGDSSIVKVDFDSFGKEGRDSRKVDVYLNDYLNPDVSIEIKGEVSK